MQQALNEAVAAELVDLERASLPEVQKTAKRKRIRIRMDPCRALRKRISLGAIFRDDGEAVDDIEQIGSAIIEHWGPIFEENEMYDEQAELFLAHITAGVGEGASSWPEGREGQIARTAPSTAMGPE